ncbi:MAG: proline dehydrogenase family protein, partial [Proteobacteria bacterium]|nr:proline dehydrogenase family protein [Pseudomonadota bacterium]
MRVEMIARPSISVKLSALHPRYEYAQRGRVLSELGGRLKKLALAASNHQMGFSIDAEEAARLQVVTAVAQMSEGWGLFRTEFLAQGETGRVRPRVVTGLGEQRAQRRPEVPPARHRRDVVDAAKYPVTRQFLDNPQAEGRRADASSRMREPDQTEPRGGPVRIVFEGRGMEADRLATADDLLEFRPEYLVELLDASLGWLASHLSGRSWTHHRLARVARYCTPVPDIQRLAEPREGPITPTHCVVGQVVGNENRGAGDHA